MRGEKRSLTWLVSHTADLMEDILDDIDMGEVDSETLKEARIARDYVICIVDKLQEVER